MIQQANAGMCQWCATLETADEINACREQDAACDELSIAVPKLDARGVCREAVMILKAGWQKMFWNTISLHGAILC